MDRLLELLKRQGHSGVPDSLAHRLRKRRFAVVRRLIELTPGEAPILDVGGTEGYWESMGYAGGSRRIILLNTETATPRFHNMVALRGDGRNLSRFRSGEFQFVHSNSTLQFMRTIEDQFAMAREIRRVGRSYYVQAPNYWFPLETHFLFPGFQWLPESIQTRLLMRHSLGWYERQENQEEAAATVRSIRLPRQNEFRLMFDDAEFMTEHFFGWPKSFVAFKALQATSAGDSIHS